MKITALDIARKFTGVRETAGVHSNPLVLGMLRLDTGWVEDDETPWCSAFVNFIAWELSLPRSKSLAARSWLKIGEPVTLEDAVPGFDIVVLKRGGGNQPGPEVTAAPGHVGFFAGRSEDGRVLILGGNQGDSVSTAKFPIEQILGIRRLGGNADSD